MTNYLTAVDQLFTCSNFAKHYLTVLQNVHTRISFICWKCCYIEAILILLRLLKSQDIFIKSIFIKNVSKIIKVENVKETLVRCCKKYYSKKPRKIIAVTGTNGKSSVADFFHQILSLNKIPVATIGTLGIKKNLSLIHIWRCRRRG